MRYRYAWQPHRGGSRSAIKLGTKATSHCRQERSHSLTHSLTRSLARSFDHLLARSITHSQAPLPVHYQPHTVDCTGVVCLPERGTWLGLRWGYAAGEDRCSNQTEVRAAGKEDEPPGLSPARYVRFRGARVPSAGWLAERDVWVHPRCKLGHVFCICICICICIRICRQCATSHPGSKGGKARARTALRVRCPICSVWGESCAQRFS
jgi:hypothetical protein